jgi:antitoxin ParD1/3/4
MPISVDLGEQLEKVVNDLLTTGRYNSKSEVLREGVRLVQEREAKLAVLDAAIAKGLADADAGRVRAADEVHEELRTRYKALS